MHETLVETARGLDWEANWQPAPHPADDLARYSYHTGAALVPLRADEACPVLFRDLGLAATARFLRRELRRLAGPYTPLTYLRTLDYVEPYTDHEHIGRLVFLQPLLLQPWHSGVRHVYVARATRTADARTIGFVPGHVALADAARKCQAMTATTELREALGGRLHDEALTDSLHRVEALHAELEAKEVYAWPLRRWLQSSDRRKHDAARAEMRRLDLTEHDIGAAWHHIPRERRAHVREALRGIAPVFLESGNP